MKHNSVFILSLLALFLGTNIAYGNNGPKTISLPQSYEGTASLKVTGIYHSSILETGIGNTTYDYKETIEEIGKINALLVGNYLIYMPAIDKPLVTGTVNYNRLTCRNSKPLTSDIAPPQNITGQYSQGLIGLYIDYEKNTYTLSIGLGAEGDSISYNITTGKVENQTKKRIELEKVELTLPLPKELKVLKGNKIIYSKVKNPDTIEKVLENKKTVEVSWEFTASNESVEFPKQINDQAGQK